jgi:hypothetical protein
MRDKQENAEIGVIMKPREDELPDLLATDLRGYFDLLVLRYASQLYAFALDRQSSRRGGHRAGRI